MEKCFVYNNQKRENRSLWIRPFPLNWSYRSLDRSLLATERKIILAHQQMNGEQNNVFDGLRLI